VGSFLSKLTGIDYNKPIKIVSICVPGALKGGTNNPRNIAIRPGINPPGINNIIFHLLHH
jgi:hypothetical protein